MHPEAQSITLFLCLAPDKVLYLGREIAKLLLQESKPAMEGVVLSDADIVGQVGAELSSFTEQIPAGAMFRCRVMWVRHFLLFEHLFGGRGESLTE
jgi:hypothetical protein